MLRILAIAYGAVAYLFFLASFLYAIGFVGNLLVPKSIDSGAEGGFASSLLVNALLLGLFALQHSVMARPGFKKQWTKLVPRPIERSTFVCVRPTPHLTWAAFRATASGRSRLRG